MYLAPIPNTTQQGLLEVGQIKPGETLVVSGAAGAVGSIVCQIGKLKGAHVVAIAGTKEKCDWLEKELGVDKALNYKDEGFYDQCKSMFKEVGADAEAGGVDVFFDNVGGKLLDFMLTRMRRYGRVVLCGTSY